MAYDFYQRANRFPDMEKFIENPGPVEMTYDDGVMEFPDKEIDLTDGYKLKSGILIKEGVEPTDYLPSSGLPSIQLITTVQNDNGFYSPHHEFISVKVDGKTLNNDELKEFIKTPEFEDWFNELRERTMVRSINYLPMDLSDVSKFELEEGKIDQKTYDERMAFAEKLDDGSNAKFIPEHDIESIAEETHEALREMKQALGDDMPAWNDAEQWMRDSTIAMIKSIEENPNQTGKEVHDSWVKQKEDAGWKYGPEKSAELKTHPLMVPYEDLPFEEQFKDDLVRHSIDTGLEMAREGKFDANELEEENKAFLDHHAKDLGIDKKNEVSGPGM